MEFDERKDKYLSALYKPDKSKKGSVDIRIKELIDEINSKKDYVTTSSCSGRINLLRKDDNAKKYEANWLIVSHEKLNHEDIENVLKNLKHIGTIWFKMESPIIHVMARNLESAQKLVGLAKKNSFKYSGIFVSKKDRFMVEIMGCEKIESLIAKEKILVDEEYIRIITEEANKKLQKSHSNLDKFLEDIKEL